MKKTLLVCAGALALLSATTSFATAPAQGAISATVATDNGSYFEGYVITPAPGEVKLSDLTNITVSFPGLGDNYITEKASDLAAVITLSDGGANTLKPSLAYREDDRKSIFIAFSTDELTSLPSGTYTLKIEARALGVLDEEGVSSPELTATYTIQGNDAALASLVWSSGAIYDAAQKTYYYANEDRSNVNNISIITVKIDKPASMEEAQWKDFAKNYQINEDKLSEVKISNGTYTVTPSSASDNGYIMVKLNLATPLTEDGTYSVTIPEGLVTFGNGKKSLAAQLDNIFTISSGTAPTVSFKDYFIDPAEDSTVENIQNVTITYIKAIDLFSDDQTIVANDLYTPSNITLTYAGDDADENNPIEYKAISAEIDEFSIFINFGDIQLPEGRYCFTVPAAFWHNSEFPQVVSDALVLYYNVAPSQYNLTSYELTPEDGKTVSELETITLQFLNAGSSDQGVLVLNDKAQDGDFSDVYIIDDKENRYDCVELDYVDEDFTKLSFTFEKITADGDYTFVIPAGFFALDVPGVPQGSSQEIKALYIVGNGSGCAAITPAAETYTVTDLAGRTVLKGADKSALTTLDAGIYIINGKKVAVAK